MNDSQALSLRKRMTDFSKRYLPYFTICALFLCVMAVIICICNIYLKNICNIIL